MAQVKKGLKVVALLEGVKGIISLFVGIGLYELAGRNLRQLAEQMVRFVHLNPTSHLPSLFISAVSSIPDNNINLFAIVAIFYSLIRLVEAYGLWNGLVWVEWFALVSGSIYLPYEIYGMITDISLLGVCIFIVNVVVVYYMATVLFSKKKEENYVLQQLHD